MGIETQSPRMPASPPRAAGLTVAAVCLVLGGISALEARHISLAHGFPINWSAIFVSTSPRWIFLAAVLPFVLMFATRYPPSTSRKTYLAAHIVAFVAVSLSHAALDSWAMAQTAPEITMLFGLIPRLARSWYNTMPTVVSMYGAVLITAWGLAEARERQRRSLRAAQLESQLQSAQLAALRAQLQPHFLYNTLNGIAALVGDVQPARAVAAIEQLGELLRASLRDDGRESITVAEEVALSEQYLALQSMRFGDRLRYECRVAPDAADCLVPVLLLQPLIENAVVHGLDASQDTFHLSVVAIRTSQGVEITITNDGSPLRVGASSSAGHGLGVSTTLARLKTAHGEFASLTLQPSPTGGTVAHIIIPHGPATAVPFIGEPRLRAAG